MEREEERRIENMIKETKKELKKPKHNNRMKELFMMRQENFLI